MEMAVQRRLNLKPRSFYLTRGLSMEEFERTPTRFELFNSLKEYESLALLAKRAEIKIARVEAMDRCMCLLDKESTDLVLKLEKIQKLIESKRATRSVTAPFEDLFTQSFNITKKILEKLRILKENMNSKDSDVERNVSEELRILDEFLNSEILRNFEEDGNQLYQQVKSNLEICDRLLLSLEA